VLLWLLLHAADVLLFEPLLGWLHVMRLLICCSGCFLQAAGVATVLGLMQVRWQPESITAPNTCAAVQNVYWCVFGMQVQ
jgi:hypothetical protein